MATEPTSKTGTPAAGDPAKTPAPPAALPRASLAEQAECRGTITAKALAGAEAEIALYGEIGYFGTRAEDFYAQLRSLPADTTTLHLRLNSPGGQVYDGMTIHSLLTSHPAKKIVHVDGIAASMASVIAMAGDEIEMPQNAFMLIHNPADLCIGDADEMRRTAEMLDQVEQQIVGIYARRSGQTAEAIAALMDDETLLAGERCAELGLCDRCTGAVEQAASVAVDWAARFPRLGRAIAKLGRGPTAQISTPVTHSGVTTMANDVAAPAAPKAATLKELKTACPGADEKFLVAQLEGEATVASASTAWMQALADRTRAAEEEIKTLKAGKPGQPTAGKAPKKGPKKDGKKADDEDGDEAEDCHDDDGHGDEGEPDDVIDAFDALVSQEVKRQVAMGRKADRIAAVVAAANKRPELHQAYLVATSGNSNRAKRMVSEKYEQMPDPPRRRQ
jgi:ATP-dependent protease ClpP protease subunit